MEVLLLEGNSSSFQLNGYCISESKILRRMIFINGSRRGWNRIERNGIDTFYECLVVDFCQKFCLKIQDLFSKIFRNFSLEEILKFLLWMKF